MAKIRWTLDTSTYSDAHLRKFRARWWHFGQCPRCRLRYNQWFFAPNVGLFCRSCATDSTPTGPDDARDA